MPVQPFPLGLALGVLLGVTAPAGAQTPPRSREAPSLLNPGPMRGSDLLNPGPLPPVPRNDRGRWRDEALPLGLYPAPVESFDDRYVGQGRPRVWHHRPLGADEPVPHGTYPRDWRPERFGR